MPSVPDLDDFPYEEQDADTQAFVPTCVSMVCQYWEIEKEWEEIIHELEYSEINDTPFENIGKLSNIIAILLEDTLQIERHLALETPRPVIANLQVDDDSVLSYHRRGTMLHAVVVVGIDDRRVTFFDPLSLDRLGTRAAQDCALADFERAWLDGWVILPL